MDAQTMREYCRKYSVLAFILCISAAASPARSACSGEALKRIQTRFESRRDGIYDRKTKLTWDRCGLGEVFRNGKCSGAIKLVKLDEAKNAAADKGGGWRLPAVEELSGLLDDGCSKPAIDRSVFSDVSAFLDGGSPYWTSSKSWMPNTFYFVDFMDGFVDAHSPGFPLAVRFVKN